MLPSTVAPGHSPTVAHEMPQAFAPCGQRGKTSIRRPRLRETDPNRYACGVRCSVPPKKQWSCCRPATT